MKKEIPSQTCLKTMKLHLFNDEQYVVIAGVELINGKQH